MAAQQTQYARRLIRDLAPLQPNRGGRIARMLTTFVVCCSLAGFANADATNTPAPSETPSSPLLIAKYQQLKNELEQSAFGSPILLNSETGSTYARGEVYALLESPFAALDETLSQPAQWCELAILHMNTKGCTYREHQVQLFVGPKRYQTPKQAYALQYQFEQLTNNGHHLHIKLTAPKGPFGTSNYFISLEAIPIDAQHSFIHFQYRYQFGFFANLAIKTYLSTLGRKKVGFTITGTDDKGEPIYIRGPQGIIERNVMRYIFAIQSVLESRKSPVEYRNTTQLVRWYALIQEHPRQLLELTREEYLSNKQREHSNQVEMQKALLQ